MLRNAIEVKSAILFLCALVVGCAFAGVHNVHLDLSPDRQKTRIDVDMDRIGTISPRSVYDIGGCGKWSVGCEILDRDYARFSEYCEFYEPLGIRSVRLQSGWAKTERSRGVYDFSWLDELVDFFHSRGFQILLEIGYGNPLYGGGGGWDLGTGLPRTEEGLAAWDRYVTELVKRYRGKIRDWSTWNEASNLWGRKGRPEYVEPEEVGRFCNRTAKLILGLQPDARIAIFSLGSAASLDVQCAFIKRAFSVIPKEDVVRYTWLLVHGYCFRPEDAEPALMAIRGFLAEMAPNIMIRQGEQGCPSEGLPTFALRNWPWSEISQAKWFMRRMLMDCSQGIQSHVYTMSDFFHSGVHVHSLNNKGLIRANFARETIGVKRAYYAVQNVVSVFDDTVNVVANSSVTNFDGTIRFCEYAKDDGRPLIAFWSDKNHPIGNLQKSDPKNGTPGDSFETRPSVFYTKSKPMQNPVWVDLFSGRIYAFPMQEVHASSIGTTYTNVPVYDSPCLLTERSVVMDDVKPPVRPFSQMIEKALKEGAGIGKGLRMGFENIRDGQKSDTKGLDI